MCNVLPKQSAGLFRRKGSTKTMCCLWGKTLVFPHTPLALFGRFDCAPARRVAALRAEYSRWRAKCEGFALTLPLPFVSKRKRKPIADAVINTTPLNYSFLSQAAFRLQTPIYLTIHRPNFYSLELLKNSQHHRINHKARCKLPMKRSDHHADQN